jgi:hypothetical protein
LVSGLLAWFAGCSWAALGLANPSPPRAIPAVRFAVAPDETALCWVEFEWAGANGLRDLTIAVDYEHATGRFVQPTGWSSMCADSTAAQTSSRTIDAADRDGLLTVRITNDQPLSDDRILPLVCAFTSGDTGLLPTAADFDVQVLAAYDDDPLPVAPLPDAAVASVRCEAGLTTTTNGVGTTTTLLPEATEAAASDPCTLTVSMADAPELSVLGFEIGYASVAGGFSGVGPFSDCQNLSIADSAVFFDSEVDRTMIVTLTVIRGKDLLAGSGEIAQCAFHPAAGSARPTAEEFLIDATVALTVEGQTAQARPTLSISAVECGAPTE